MKMQSRLILITCLLAAGTANAQLKGFGIGPYVERAFPAGNSEDRLKAGLGAGLSADIKLPGRLGLTGSAGFIHFKGRTFNEAESSPAKYSNINAFPLRAGLKFRPLPLIYFKMEAGVAKYSNRSESAFLFSPGVGVRVLGIDLQGKYERWYDAANTSFWGLRAGFNL